MSTPDDAEIPQPAPEAETPGEAAPLPAAAPEAVEPEMTRVEQRVELERGVRFGRILLVAGGVGAVLASMITLMLPIDPEENYTMSQVVGFMLVVGAVAGLFVGAILSLVLARIAKRQRGFGVAIQTDVRQ